MKRVLVEYCGATRYFFNKALAISKKATNIDGSTDWGVAYNSNYLRKELVTKSRKAWENAIPSRIRNEAVVDLKKSKDSAMQLLKNGKVRHFRIRYKSKKDPTGYFRVPKAGIHVIETEGKVSFEIYPNKTRALLRQKTNCSVEDARRMSVLKTSIPWNDEAPLKIMSDSTVCFNRRTGAFFLYTPAPFTGPRASQNAKITLRNSSSQRKKIVALDPGVRAFITTFDEHGDSIQVDALHTILIKKETIRSIQRKIDEAKKEYRLLSGRPKKQKRLEVLRLKLQKANIEENTKNRVKDMHYQLASFLCRTYDTIFLPSFGTKDMVSGRTILRKTTKDRMLTLSHYKFKQILTQKAKEFRARLIIMGEEYTTKTCSACGTMNDNVGGSRTFRCHACPYRAERDLNAARNIFVKGSEELGFRMLRN